MGLVIVQYVMVLVNRNFLLVRYLNNGLLQLVDRFVEEVYV